MARNLARSKKDEYRPALRVEKAAGTVSSDLDKVIHERIRLGIISALAANQKLSFGDLKQLLDTSDGNLSVHARKLEEAGYISVKKSFLDRMPLTEFKITAAGRRALEHYLDHMETLIKAMRQ
ncbi:winged helix-turn-helix domain-containing protein [Leptolyngbya sp. 7M]|uniref:winged helix-turn-helix domain-containing protein n=1 Tax=Leptolyngbya sp. 7M TaxID=2812896 RepID=UPI001B8C152B|nr:transcriptional regulator [Leptolyngbya sp. 7M]QYO65633.1 transcriptional regulator [Leptolyngbya sp. 7M]